MPAAPLLHLDGADLQFGQRRTRLTTAQAGLWLQLLLTAAERGHPVYADEWTWANRRQQPGFVLHRNQVMRVFNDVERALAELAVPLRIVHPPRRRSTGPWQVQIHGPLRWQIQSASTDATLPDHNALLRADCFFADAAQLPSAQLVLRLCTLLHRLLHSEVLFQQGLLAEADEVLAELPPQWPLSSSLRKLSSSLRNWLNIRRARILRILGRFDPARRLLQTVLSGQSEPALAELARVQQALLLYNQAPAHNYAFLLRTTPPPEARRKHDHMACIDWHNLQFLLLRRLQENDDSTDIGHHHRALQHFQAALWLCLQADNFSRAQDLVVNLAFYLQKMKARGWADIPEIIACYQLSLLLNDKAAYGDYSMWDKIFFGEFFWDNEAEILTRPEGLALLTPETDPRQARFYHHGLSKLQYCGDVRQQILMYVLFCRYLCRHGSHAEQVAAARQAAAIMAKHPALTAELHQTGYAAHIDGIRQLAAPEMIDHQ